MKGIPGGDGGWVFTLQEVSLFDSVGFAGRSRALSLGQYRFWTPDDFNDVTSSIRVPQGLVAVLYEHADEGGGYGRSVDLLEDWPDLSTYGFDKNTSYITVFAASRDVYVWARGSLQNGQFVAGHWERQRAHPPPPNPVAVGLPALAGPDADRDRAPGERSADRRSPPRPRRPRARPRCGTMRPPTRWASSAATSGPRGDRLGRLRAGLEQQVHPGQLEFLVPAEAAARRERPPSVYFKSTLAGKLEAYTRQTSREPTRTTTST